MKATLLRTILVIGLLGLSFTASAASSAVDVGVNLYRHGDYKGAVVALDTALKNGVSDASDRATARIYLASAYEARGEKDQARQVLTQLFQEQPGTPIDSALFPPSFISLAESVRSQVTQAGAHVNPPAGQPAQVASAQPEPAGPQTGTAGPEGSEIGQGGGSPSVLGGDLSGFALNFRFGYAIPGGTAYDAADGSSVSQSDVYSGAVLGELDLGWRFSPNWGLNFYLGLGAAQLSSNSGGSGSHAEVQAGIEGEFHVLPFGMVDPWFGLGVGYEAVGFKDSLNPDITYAIGGAAFRAEFGADFRLGSHFVVGPLVTGNFGWYSSASATDSSGSSVTVNFDSSTMHEWFTFGARIGMVF